MNENHGAFKGVFNNILGTTQLSYKQPPEERYFRFHMKEYVECT